jgi:hypothetical protein
VLKSRSAPSRDIPVVHSGRRWSIAHSSGEPQWISTRRTSGLCRAGAGPVLPDLHVLVEAPDATLVSTAIMWLDERNRTAKFEPAVVLLLVVVLLRLRRAR